MLYRIYNSYRSRCYGPQRATGRLHLVKSTAERGRLWPPGGEPRQESAEVRVIEGGPEAFGRQTAPDGALLAQEIERELAQAGQVLGAVPAPHRTGIFAEEHIEHPVQAILDVPVLADRLPQDRRLGRQAGEVIARVDGPLGARPPLRLDLDDRAQARPGAARVQTRQQVRIAQRVVAPTLQPPMPLVEGLGAVLLGRHPGGRGGRSEVG